MQKHSELGASGAERWMKCPGSVRFLGTVGLGETEEHDYTKAGTAVHAAAAACLAQGSDAWEVVGQEFEKVKLTVDMTSGLQVYLDEVRRLQAVPNMQSYVEYKINTLERLTMGRLSSLEARQRMMSCGLWTTRTASCRSK